MSTTTPAEPRYDAGSIFAALDVANLFRLAIGVPTLEQLPVAGSQPSHSQSCVLAQALNCGCRITYSAGDEDPMYAETLAALPNEEERAKFDLQGACYFGGTYFGGSGEHTAEALAKALATESGVPGLEFKSADGDYGEEWGVPLRDEITKVAQRFDNHDLNKLVSDAERALLDCEVQESEFGSDVYIEREPTD